VLETLLSLELHFKVAHFRGSQLASHLCTPAEYSRFPHIRVRRINGKRQSNEPVLCTIRDAKTSECFRDARTFGVAFGQKEIMESKPYPMESFAQPASPQGQPPQGQGFTDSTTRSTEPPTAVELQPAYEYPQGQQQYDYTGPPPQGYPQGQQLQPYQGQPMAVPVMQPMMVQPVTLEPMVVDPKDVQPMMVEPMMVQTMVAAPSAQPTVEIIKVQLVQEQYCGPISLCIGLFLLPCICCCPVDERWVPAPGSNT